MLTKSKSITTFALFSLITFSVFADEINDISKEVSNKTNIAEYTAAKEAYQADQYNLSETVKTSIKQVGELDQADISSREYYTVKDGLDSQYSRGKVTEIIKFNELLMDYQRSEIALMESTGKYQEAKNDLSQKYERREDVVARINSLENFVSQLSVGMGELIKVNESLKAEMGRLSAAANSTVPTREAKSEEGRNSDIDKILNTVKESDNQNFSDSTFPYLLTGTSLSKGEWVATFMNNNMQLSKTKTGETLSGWVINSVEQNYVTISNGETSKTLERSR